MINNYLFNLGIDFAQLMNLIYSSMNSTNDLYFFLKGFNFIPNSQIINNLYPRLPISASELTQGLLWQPSICKIFQTGVYNLNQTSPVNSTQIENITMTMYAPVISISSNTLNIKAAMSSCGPHDTYKFNFIKSNTSYYDSKMFFYNQNIWSGYSYNAYEKTISHTFFNQYLTNCTSSMQYNFNLLDTNLTKSFSDLINQLSYASNISYNQANMILNFSNLNTNVIEAFSHFAKINLNV